AHLSATLSDQLGPVAGAVLHFTFQGLVYDGTTDTNGVATVTVPVNEPAGPNDVIVDYDGDGLSRSPSSARGTFTVRKRASSISFTAKGGVGDMIGVDVALADAATREAIAGAQVSISVDGAQSAVVTTDDTGHATATFAVVKPKGRTFGVA